MKTGKKHFLVVMLVLLGSIIMLLAFSFLSNPAMHDSCVLAFSQSTTRDLNLTAGDHVSIWLSAMPPGMSGRSAQLWVVKFNVTDPSNNTILEEIGIAATGSLYPLTFVAHQDGVYEMHFSNTVGGSFDKTISFSYRITQSIYGIPIEHYLVFALAVDLIFILILEVRVFMDRSKAPSSLEISCCLRFILHI